MRGNYFTAWQGKRLMLSGNWCVLSGEFFCAFVYLYSSRSFPGLSQLWLLKIFCLQTSCHLHPDHWGGREPAPAKKAETSLQCWALQDLPGGLSFTWHPTQLLQLGSLAHHLFSGWNKTRVLWQILQSDLRTPMLALKHGLVFLFWHPKCYILALKNRYFCWKCPFSSGKKWHCGCRSKKTETV